MARLSHPNVVQVYDVGETGDPVFMAMELIPGVTLYDWIRDADRPYAELLAVFVQAGRDLKAAHDAGLVRRRRDPRRGQHRPCQRLRRALRPAPRPRPAPAVAPLERALTI
jgi:hypothetical protein